MIKDIAIGSKGSAIFLCTDKQQLFTKKSSPYLKLQLRDVTGTVGAMIWDLSYVQGNFNIGSFLQVEYTAGIYNEELQLTITSARIAAEGTYHESDYLPTTTYNVKEMYADLLEYIKRVSSNWLRTLLHNIFSDSAMRQQFIKCSAAKTVHHAFVGGLLQHTLENTKLADSIAQQYSEANRDLIITASILHDIGKLQELSAFPANDYTDAGQYLGHVYMSTSLVEREILKIEGFPEILKLQLLHCIISHHGELEYGAPVTPKTMEAYIVSMADLIGSKLEVMRENLPEDTAWSSYVKYYGNYIRRTVDWGEFN